MTVYMVYLLEIKTSLDVLSASKLLFFYAFVFYLISVGL